MQWLLKFTGDELRAGELGLAHAVRPELIALALAGLALGAWWLYRREAARLPRGRRIALAALRAIGIALLLFAALGPVLRLRSHDAASGVIAVAIDASRSMSLQQGKSTRLDAARDALGEQLARLEGAGAVRLYAFGDSLRPVDGGRLATLAPADEATHLAAALKDAAQSARGQPLESVLVLSDGVATDGADAETVARWIAAGGATVHAVGFGGGGSGPDLAISEVRHPPTVQAGSLVEIAVGVRRRGVAGPLTVKLFRGDTFLQSADLPDAADGRQVATIRFVAEQAGATYRVEVPADPRERLLDNNKRDFRIEVSDARVEVLFVEGSPRHEFAFIRRCMADDRFFKVVTLLRLGHDRWYTAGDNDGSVLSNGFPKTAEALGRFKAIILSDIEAAQFSPEQQALISDFVTNRGGGLLMLGGTNSFNAGGWANTPIAELLPVRLADAAPFDAGEYTFSLTKEGAAHEILSLAADPGENQGQWSVMPTLKGMNPLYSAKPGAHVLAERAGAGAQPAAILLAVQEVGAGRVGAFAPANSWRWKMLRPADDDAFRRFWSQMIRWLAAGSKELLTVETDTGVAEVGQPVTITANVLDRAHRPADDAKAMAKVKDPFGHVDEVPLAWVLSESGVYRASYRPADVGDYEITASAELPSGALEPRTIAFTAAKSSPEFARPDLDGAALERIARAGGGTVDLNGDLTRAVDAIVERAASRRVASDTLEERELRDAPALLLAIAACWIVEWLLRRRGGLT